MLPRQHPTPARIASAVLGRQGPGQASDREQGRGAGVRPAGRGWSAVPVTARAPGSGRPFLRAAAPGDGAGFFAFSNHPITRFMLRYFRPPPLLPRISVLPAPDGTFIHPRVAECTKLCSSHNRPAPEAVTSARADLEHQLSGRFSDTAPHLCPFFAPCWLRYTSGRASDSRHWQRPDPPQHIAEQPPGQVPFRQRSQ